MRNYVEVMLNSFIRLKGTFKVSAPFPIKAIRALSNQRRNMVDNETVVLL